MIINITIIICYYYTYYNYSVPIITTAVATIIINVIII